MSDFIQCHFLPDLSSSHPNRNHNRCFSPALSPALPLITISSVFPQEMRWNLRFASTCFMVATFGWTLSSGCVDTSLWFQPSVSLWQWKPQGGGSHPPNCGPLTGLPGAASTPSTVVTDCPWPPRAPNCVVLNRMSSRSPRPEGTHSQKPEPSCGACPC